MSIENATPRSIHPMVVDIGSTLVKKADSYEPRSVSALILGTVLMGATTYNAGKNIVDTLCTPENSFIMTSPMAAALGVEEKADISNDPVDSSEKEFIATLLWQKDVQVRTPAVAGHEHWHTPDTIREKIAFEANIIRTMIIATVLFFAGAGKRKKKSGDRKSLGKTF